MPESVADLAERAKRLSPEDRAQLVLAIIESLDSAEAPDVEQAWLAEVRRRSAELDRGDAKAIPAAEVFKRMYAAPLK